ncbi:MAG: PIN domain protein, partial [Verrucomicrobiota bacterium]
LWKEQTIVDIEENEELLVHAEKLSDLGLRSKDSLHIACSVYANANHFLTTDKQILSKSSEIDDIKIVDPIDFIKENLQ